MILDKELIFSDKQELTEAGASTNKVDQGAAGDSDDALWLLVYVTTAITGTLGFDFECDDNSDFNSAKKLVSLAAASRASAENIYTARLPKGCERYLRVLWTGSPTAGNVSAFLVKDVKI